MFKHKHICVCIHIHICLNIKMRIFKKKKWLYFDPHLIEILTMSLFLEKASLTWAHNWIKQVEIFTIWIVLKKKQKQKVYVVVVETILNFFLNNFLSFFWNRDLAWRYNHEQYNQGSNWKWFKLDSKNSVQLGLFWYTPTIRNNILCGQNWDPISELHLLCWLSTRTIPYSHCSVSNKLILLSSDQSSICIPKLYFDLLPKNICVCV